MVKIPSQSAAYILNLLAYFCLGCNLIAVPHDRFRILFLAFLEKLKYSNKSFFKHFRKALGGVSTCVFVYNIDTIILKRLKQIGLFSSQHLLLAYLRTLIVWNPGYYLKP